jgi:hypothetical protein
MVGAKGQVARRNASFPLIRPVAGVVYADSRSLSTGQGMHGAAGTREVHNFCAVSGPDFQRHFTDPAPTGNADIAPTVRQILSLNPPAGPSGRVLDEALNHGEHQIGPSQQQVLKSYLVLQGQEVVTSLHLTQFGGRIYLDDSSVNRTPLNGSP